MSKSIEINIQKTIEVDEDLFLQAAREEYAEVEDALREWGEIDRGVGVSLDDVFVRMYDNGHILLDIDSSDIIVEGGLRDVDCKTGEILDL